MNTKYAQKIRTTSVATITVVSTHIVENKIMDSVHLMAKDVEELKEANTELMEGANYAVLVVPGTYSTISNEAKELSASKEFKQNTIAKAILVQSLAHAIIVKFYISLNKPHIETRAFKVRDKAISWLQEKVNNSIAAN